MRDELFVGPETNGNAALKEVDKLEGMSPSRKEKVNA